MAEVLSTHTPELFAGAVERTACCLSDGDVVAIPTETVYGLAANALNPHAVAHIFDVKGRPSHNPIIVHVADLNMARRCVSEWTKSAGDLANAFWPGPLTIVLRRSSIIPDIVTGGGETVGVRWPSHPFVQAVIRLAGFPLAAPSANVSSGISPTNAEHVQKALGSRIPLIIDGGQSQVGIESTVIDLTTDSPRILRPGMIHAESISAVLGRVQLGSAEAGALRSPGMLDKHYSPRARLVIMKWQSDSDLRSEVATMGFDVAKTFVIAHACIPSGALFPHVSVVPHDAEAFARALYSELHRCDDSGAELIVIEEIPQQPEWRAIRDRLSRAAAK